MRIFLDSPAVIYLVERVPAFRDAVLQRIAAVGTVLVTSDLTRMECRVKPIRENNASLLTEYDLFFNGADLEITRLTSEVVDRATDIRASYGYKAVDSIQLAAAIGSRCDLFLTNDHQLDRFAEITVEVL